MPDCKVYLTEEQAVKSKICINNMMDSLYSIAQEITFNNKPSVQLIRDKLSSIEEDIKNIKIQCI